MPITAYRSRYALYWLLALCLFAPDVFAHDFGLINPAAREFDDIQFDTRKQGNFAQKSPVFNDRPLPTTRSPETIRQVSVNEHDPFPVISQPAATQTMATPTMVLQPPPAADWGASHPAVPLNAVPMTPMLANPMLAQHNAIPHNPHVAMHMFPAGAEMGHLPQFAQHPQQWHPQQWHAAAGMNFHMIDPHALLYAQHAFANPHGVNPHGIDPHFAHTHGMWAQQNMPDQHALQQALMFQEMARQQAEAQERAGNANRQEANNETDQAEIQWSLNDLMPIRVTSPLGETLLAGAHTISPFNTPTGPHKGVGMPLVNRSWLDHPWYFGGFVGAMCGSELVSKMIRQKEGGTGGVICGYNFSDYWGIESRLHFASIDIYDTDYARRLFEDIWTQSNPDSAVPPSITRTNELAIFDVAIHYYPLGNAKWRPFFKGGLGIGTQKFVNTFGHENQSSIVTMPLGVGMRYWWNERIAIQADLVDNIIFASGIAKTQHNFAFTVGLTYAFGSARQRHPVHYWPAMPSMGSRW